MNKEILRLALPNIISNISVPLLSTVDTALMGRMSALHIGAVGVGAMIFNFIYWNFGFLRMGTTGLTAQAYGSKNEVEAIHVLGRSFLVVLVVAVVILLFQGQIGNISFSLMNVTGEQLELVKTYFFIRLWAAPATLGLYALMGWFFGMQNAIYPLSITILINVVNIVLSFIFIFSFQMEVEGVAYSTVIAQYVGFIVGLIILKIKYGNLFDHCNNELLLKKDLFLRFFEVNRDIFIRTLCLTFAFGFFYSKSATLGEMVLAVNVILLQFVNWMSYGIDGFAFAAESIVGKYRGANELSKLRKSIRLIFIWAAALALMVCFVYGFLGEYILMLFTDEGAIIQEALPLMYWMIIITLVGFPCYIWDGIFIGLTASRAMRNSMLISLFIYLAGYFFFASSMTNQLLWMLLALFLAVRGVMQTVMFKSKGVVLS